MFIIASLLLFSNYLFFYRARKGKFVANPSIYRCQLVPINRIDDQSKPHQEKTKRSCIISHTLSINKLIKPSTSHLSIVYEDLFSGALPLTVRFSWIKEKKLTWYIYLFNGLFNSTSRFSSHICF